MEKYENISIPPRLEDDGQTIIPFGHEEVMKEIHDEEVEKIIKIVGDLNLKYPKARLSPNVVKSDGKEGFIVGGMNMTQEGLEEYVKEMNDMWDHSTDNTKDM